MINSIALSNGDMPPFPVQRLKALDRKCRSAQQRLAAARRGSKRRLARKRHVAALTAEAARVRKHWNHVETTNIARAYGTVCIEALNIGNMTRSASGTLAEPGTNVAQKAGLNRAILATGWGQFETLLAYKMNQRGSTLIRVDPKNTSRRCPLCGHVDARNRESQASFRCVACNHEAHADVNAAVNILQAGTRPALVRTSADLAQAEAPG